jgi:hypothetical protein
MIAFVRRSAKRMVCVGVLFAAAAAGIAYAAIPDGNGVYTACMLNKVGTVRLIDPSLPASNLMSHCTGAETRFTFNQQGQQGSPGLPGAPGKDGANGVSPTVSQLSNGDPNCGAGGAAITDAGGNTAYVCNGADGKDGQPFSGTFTSPDGKFSITVDDTGINLTGPSNSIKLMPDGSVATIAGTTFKVTSGGATELVSSASLDLQSGGDTSLVAGDSLSATATGSLSATSGGSTSVDVGKDLTVQTSKAATVTVGTSLNATAGGAANLLAGSLDLKATGTAILEATGPLALKGSVITQN